MKAADRKRLVAGALPPGERWVLKSTMAYRVPLRRMLFGAAVSSHSSGDFVFVSRITVPLFLSYEFMVGTWDERMYGPRGQMFPVDDVDAIRDALAVAVQQRTETQALQLMANHPGSGDRGIPHEETAYAQIILGELDRAVVSLARNLESMQKYIEERGDEDGAGSERRARVMLVADLLESGGRDAAMAQLDQWVDESITRFRLDRDVSS